MSNKNIKDKIAVPYAEALVDIAQSNNLLSETSNDLSSLSTILYESQDLQIFLSSPLINISVKKELLKNLFRDQLQDFVINFLLVLADRRRINLIKTIIEKYLELTYKLESVVIAEVSSAVELSMAQQENVVDKIKLLTKSSNVKLIINKQPHLIGGFIIKIGSKVIDASLAGKLARMSMYLNAS
uniref:ATP synthase subunit delta, chloroplastic n=1 Tax=Kuetzingia canaliculata TaxID=228262 RepID=A0A1Z1MPS1_KUECA|nr:ATP synthase CF1 subunit delta [Kuetzingia canaliculata]ARW67859.1 ATP synthase CF1 subunit delta [Kuetzingia canaliculata]